jgi:peptide/nickel transport system substrate-binding protein
LTLVWTGREGRWIDHELWNPYAIGSNHQSGPGILYEPLAYYSAFADKEYLWLAESYTYSPDFKELTVKTRSGITWSDGVPFSAEDVAYTLNSLRELGPKVRWGVDVQQFMQEARATDPNTVLITFKVPAPRFFYFMTYKYDIGVYIVPQHIFQAQDWTTFKHFDLDKDWPVTTSPWKVVFASPERSSIGGEAWWAVRLAWRPCPGRAQHLAAVAGGIAGPGMITTRWTFHVPAQLPCPVFRSSQNHHPFRAPAAWLHGLVAVFVVCQQRKHRSTTGYPLGLSFY